MHIQVGAAKIGKYATSESGDTLELIERPHGGISVVLADGQRSGKAAKTISNLVASKAISLLSEGIRDGAVARATHDYLYTHRRGKVSATLNIVSLDMISKTLVLSRNSHCPIIVQSDVDEQTILDHPAPPIGVNRGVKPQIKEMPLTVGTLAVIFTDGLYSAGERSQDPIDVEALVNDLYYRYIEHPQAAQTIADELLNEAVRRENGRATDDISVLVVAVLPEAEDDVRRMSVSFPVPPLLRP